MINYYSPLYQGIRVSTVVMPSSAQFKERTHLPTDNLYSNNFLVKTSSNSLWPFNDCKNPNSKSNFYVKNQLNLSENHFTSNLKYFIFKQYALNCVAQKEFKKKYFKRLYN